MRLLTFSGHQWLVKSSHGLRVGPGNNVFTDASGAVWVDAQGAVHLTIRRRRHAWESTELVALAPLGHGRYRFQMVSPRGLDPNVVVGMFLYREDHHEIDIELGRFGRRCDPHNAQFVVQPNDRHPNGFAHRFTLERGACTLTHEIAWRPDRIGFRTHSPRGQRVAGAMARCTVPAEGLVPRINLWLYAGDDGPGRPPADGRDVEVVLRASTLVPWT